ncbi:hypothetical protein D9C73_010148 [Collichthys lucidus]|uniref:Uncharacterized protein n=1 Tax=Collichthys lucidus TaxID=240159 RepID=A0A4U5UMU7_COLLU|nr:hypothetical protein D9C73_010148 [Collichthys lucidus]
MVVVRDATPLPTGHHVEAQQAPAPVTPVASTIQSPSALSAVPAAPSAGSSDTAGRQMAALPSALPAPSTVQPHSACATPLAASPLRNVEAVRRRTARSRAGQHSNLHHLPRPANEIRFSMEGSAFNPGNLVTWNDLQYSITGSVHVENSDFDKLTCS